MKILAPSAAPSKNTLAQKVLCAFSGKSYSGALEDKEREKKKKKKFRNPCALFKETFCFFVVVLKLLITLQP